MQKAWIDCGQITGRNVAEEQVLAEIAPHGVQRKPMPEGRDIVEKI